MHSSHSELTHRNIHSFSHNGKYCVFVKNIKHVHPYGKNMLVLVLRIILSYSIIFRRVIHNDISKILKRRHDNNSSTSFMFEI